MKNLSLLILSFFLVSPLIAQDLSFEDIQNASSRKELPKDKEITSYLSMDGNVYNIGDELTIGFPTGKALGQTIMAYIVKNKTVVGAKHSDTTVTIEGYKIMSSTKLAMTVPIGCISSMKQHEDIPKFMIVAIVSSDKGKFNIINLDMALHVGEVYSNNDNEM